MPDTFPLELADRCVKCGLCLPHCPTYQLTEDEAESPRGRIALMQGLATNLLEPSARLQGHLDQCLSCRSCEVVCPADVPYGELIDQGRALVRRQSTTTAGTPLASRLFLSPVLRRLAMISLWLAQRLGLPQALQGLKLPGLQGLARQARYLPPIRRLRSPRTQQPSEVRGRVALFTGCVSSVFEADVLQDAADLLAACGLNVRIPDSQGCCGAIYQHNGEPGRARTLAERNIAAFSGNYDVVTGIASGCTAMLREYPLVTGQAETFSRKLVDISQCLLDWWPDGLALQPLQARVAVHDPCTLKNVLKTSAAPYALLKKLPGLEVSALADNATCCGAAGDYFLRQAQMSDALGKKKRDALLEQQPDFVVTSNIGCAMQLRAQIRETGLAIEVLHPVSLLRRQLAVE